MYALTLVLLFIIRLRFPSNRSIADIITKRYSQETLRTVRKFESIDFKHKKCLLDIEFLNNCLNHELYPTFVRFKVSNAQLKNSKVHKECQLRLLRQELASKTSRLNSLQKRLNLLKLQVRRTISWIDFVNVSSTLMVRITGGRSLFLGFLEQKCPIFRYKILVSKK